jgi:chromosome segregation ATPase
MDTQLTTATERAVDLRKKIAALNTRKHEAESALSRENDAQLKATAERASLVEELTGADDATAGWAHREIDRLDSTLSRSSRVSEGLSKSLSRIASEIAALNAELAEATRIIEQEKREKALVAFKIQFQQAMRSAEDALGNARAALAALNLTASRGVEECGIAAQEFAATLLSEFRHQQNNPELCGWRESRPNYGNLQFTVRPMVKG